MPVAAILGGWQKGVIDYSKLKTQRKYDYKPLNANRFKQLELPSISTKSPRIKGNVMFKNPSSKSINASIIFEIRKATGTTEPYDYNSDIKFRNNKKSVTFDP